VPGSLVSDSGRLTEFKKNNRILDASHQSPQNFPGVHSVQKM
jgi:hypothetical protein